MIDISAFLYNCKSAGNAYGGSNPPAPTNSKKPLRNQGFLLFLSNNSYSISTKRSGAKWYVLAHIVAYYDVKNDVSIVRIIGQCILHGDNHLFVIATQGKCLHAVDSWKEHFLRSVPGIR